MGIVFESSTPIEFLLKEALIKENLFFYEQYRIGSGGRFSTVKYVADFLVIHENIRLIVECDGHTYHSNSKQRIKQVKRDAWLLKRSYKVLHFSTEEIRYKMPFVINVIKYNLGIIDVIPTNVNQNGLLYSKKQPQKDYEVALFCYYQQIPQGICVTYMYEDKVHNRFSEVRKKQCKNLAPQMAESVAIYMALLDLKRDVSVQIFYAGQVFDDHFDVNKKIRSNLVLLSKGSDLLRRHNFGFTHINLYMKYSKHYPNEHKIMLNLRNQCLLSCKDFLNGKEFVAQDYNSL